MRPCRSCAYGGKPAWQRCRSPGYGGDAPSLRHTRKVSTTSNASCRAGQLTTFLAMLVSMTVNINSDANPAPRPARCNFCVRYPAPGGKWTFVAIRLANWWSNGAIPLWMPPSVGDLITLHPAHGQELEGGPVYRVVDRMWVTAVYGSGSWPLGKAAPVEGPLMEIIVEPAPGLYADQAPSGDDD